MSLEARTKTGQTRYDRSACDKFSSTEYSTSKTGSYVELVNCAAFFSTLFAALLSLRLLSILRLSNNVIREIDFVMACCNLLFAANERGSPVSFPIDEIPA